MELFGAAATALAVFGLLMAIFGGALMTPRRLDAIRAVAIPRHRYERLVTADQPVWERLLAPVATRLAARAPAFASQVSERDIIRAGFDPEVDHAGRGVRGEARPRRRRSSASGLALTPFFGAALLLALPLAFVGYVFPTEYLGVPGEGAPGADGSRAAGLPRARPTARREARPRACRRRRVGRAP